VISGFLITSHLLAELRCDGRVQFATFYAKRARRILPASFVVLSFSVVAALIWYPPLLMREVWMGAVATAFYLPNMLFAVQGTNYLAESTPSLFQHYWSLGIEEQFYLVWPLLLSLLYWRIRQPKTLFAILLGTFAAAFALCIHLTFRSQPWAFFSLPTRAWELGVGGLVAFLLTYRPRVLTNAVAATLGWIGLIGLIASAALFNSATQFPGYWAAVPVLGTAAVIVAGGSRPAYGPYALLSLRVMQFVGLISYSLYLVHWPLLMIPQAAVGFENPLPLWSTLLIGAISFPVAWLTYRFVEEPGRTGSWLTSARPRRSLVASGAASVTLALAASGIYVHSTTRQLDSGESAPETKITAPPTPTLFVPTNLTPSLRGAHNDQPIIYADGCHLGFSDTEAKDCVYGDLNAPRIVLFGDSHAAQWFPAVLRYAELNGYSVETHTKSSCPSVSASVLRNGVPYVECDEWRSAVVAKLNAEQPALVLLANYGAVTLANQSADYQFTWSNALTKTLRELSVSTAVILDTPDLKTTPAVCLSAHLGSALACGKPRAAALDAPARIAEVRVAAEEGVPLIDMTDYVCTTDRCEPIVGNTLIYRDAHHITATFSELLAGQLGAQIDKIIPAPDG